MNQSILFNDDLVFEQASKAWKMTGLMSGELLVIYFHSSTLPETLSIDLATKYDLEETTEIWLEKNEPENGEIHIYD